MRCKTETLIEAIEESRNLTLFYLSKLGGKDIYREFNAGNTSLNSVAWIVAHLAWAEEFLVLRAINGGDTQYSWTEKFRIGSARPERYAYPEFKITLDAFQEIHLKAMDVLTRLTDEELEQPNKINLKFQKGDTVKVCLLHHIRHESSHAGHLSWLCRMHGVQTV